MVRNVGKVDRILRFLFSILLNWLGLIIFNGLNGNIFGLLIALIAIIPFTMSVTGSCPVFKWFHIHSLSKKEFDRYGDPYSSNENK